MKTTKIKNSKKSETEPLTPALSPPRGEGEAPGAEAPAAERLPDPVMSRVSPSSCSLGEGFNRSNLALNAEFERDIAARGVIAPLIVRVCGPGGHGFQIFAGARRWTAALNAGLAEVPVAVYPAETSTKAMLQLRLIENLQREGLTALDEARQMQEALATGDYGQGRDAVTALARQVGKSTSHVYSRLRLLKLPEQLRKAWAEGKVSQSIVELVAQLPDESDQLEALKAISNEGNQYRSDGTWVKEPMSVRHAKAYLVEQFQADLSTALWDRDDAALDPKAGACSNCPFRGGHAAGAVGVDDPNVCTRRECYQKKRQLALQQRVDQAVAMGKEVLPLKTSEEMFRYGHLSSGHYKDPGDKPWQDKEGRNYEKLVGRNEPTPVFAVKPKDGKLVKLYKNAALIEALVKAGHKWAKPVRENGSAGSGAKPVSKEAKAKAVALEVQRKAEEGVTRAVHRELLNVVMTAVENPKLSERQHASLWAFIFKLWMEDIGNPYAGFYERRKMAQSSLKSITNLSAKSDLVLGVVRGQCIEVAMTQWEDEGPAPDALKLLAGIVGVDAADHEKKFRAELAKLKPAEPGKPEKNGKPAKPAKHAKAVKGKKGK